jgi:uncharacterized protein (TIGR03067 family)
LAICWNYRDGARPDQFRTEADDGRALIRLRRVDTDPAVLPGLPMNAQPGAKDPVRGPTEFGGVWEQISLCDDKGRLEERGAVVDFAFSKRVLVYKGRRCYRVQSTVCNLRIVTEEFKADAKAGRIDFVDPDDDRTCRALYELKGQELTMCWHGGGKTLRRPDKIAPTADGFTVNVFKKLPGENSAGRVNEPGVYLSGLWETVGYEVGGVKLENELQKLQYGKNRKVYCFQRDYYTLIGTDGSALCVVHRPYGVNPKAGKNAIDFESEDKKTIPAIYELRGDSLAICWNDRGGARPDQFRTEADDGRALIRMKRVDTP